ncbi:hypothetical protein NDU88_001636 [Pleurodeles waltl]|uniref:Uncharacterized protein n=1 Tax=Pleurodeles waltl TaxID=8319 RepID=A0AAV7Q6L9_PLEWA|nr:hypothetical protein NDU88_001636 [Pleurodeles waltl]
MGDRLVHTRGSVTKETRAKMRAGNNVNPLHLKIARKSASLEDSARPSKVCFGDVAELLENSKQVGFASTQRATRRDMFFKKAGPLEHSTLLKDSTVIDPPSDRNKRKMQLTRIKHASCRAAQSHIGTLSIALLNKDSKSALISFCPYFCGSI